MAHDPRTTLDELERLKTSYGAGAVTRKLELLRRLERRRLGTADEVLRLHECLCFWRAYPDDRELLGRVERMLAGFAKRGDLRRHATDLADSGVAGTPIFYSFFWPTARWLVRNWPDRLSIDWSELEEQERLGRFMHLLVTYAESPAMDMLDHSPREWIERLKAADETDAAFLVRRFEALPGDSFTRETLFESFEFPFRLDAGPGTPSRTGAVLPRAEVAFQIRPFSRKRPNLRREVERPPRSVRRLPRAEGAKLIDLAREAMVTRSRDLEVFAQADPEDVCLIDCGEGLQFACYGAKPERRLLLEAVYGFVTLKNGVPIGYVLASSLFESTEVAYNIFETYRGAEAAGVFGRVLATIRHLFGARAFSIDPYQLGYGNAEGLQSGAWWFYYKLGFRPRDPEVRRVLRGELSRMKKDPRHRSGPRTLERLASEYMYLDLDRSGREVLGGLPLGNVGLRIADTLARRFGADREAALRTCAREAEALTGLRSLDGFTRAERMAWMRWSPLVTLLPGVKRWSRKNRRDLVRVVRAKGGQREIEFVRRFDRHALLRRAVLRLTESPDGAG